jgi:hypothetical protein
MRMLARIPWDLDLYPAMDHKQMKVIDANYSVRVGYWALKYNVQEYKIYVIMIRCSIWILWITCDKFLETIHNKLQLQDPFIMPSRISIGDEQSKPMFINKSITKEVARKWKWSTRWQVWVGYFEIWCKLGCTSRIERRNTIPRGGQAKTLSQLAIKER